jgi:hypothetical protein
LELHIEQGPTLVAEKLPAAVVTGIRGCKRFRNARCVGRYGHSGAVNRPHRHDAVAATVALIESADEGQIEKIVQVLIPVLKPEQQALLIGRFAEIQESLNKRKAIVKAQANGNGKAS